MTTRVLVRFLLLLPVGAVGCFDAGQKDPCEAGTLSCKCTAEQECQPGLSCSDGTCRNPSGGTDSDTDATSSSATMSTTATASATSGGSTGPATATSGSSSSGPATDSVGTTSGGTAATTTTTGPGTGTGSTTGPTTGGSTGGAVTHTVFVTLAKLVGDAIGGLQQADDICMAAINDGQAWRAILSSSVELAQDRITIEGAVLNMNGEVIANDAAELWAGTALNEVGFAEDGTAIPESDLAWVGSEAENCQEWTSQDPSVTGATGLPTQQDAWLGTGVSLGCQVPLHLYCISQ